MSKSRMHVSRCLDHLFSSPQHVIDEMGREGSAGPRPTRRATQGRGARTAESKCQGGWAGVAAAPTWPREVRETTEVARVVKRKENPCSSRSQAKKSCIITQSLGPDRARIDRSIALFLPFSVVGVVVWTIPLKNEASACQKVSGMILI